METKNIKNVCIFVHIFLLVILLSISAGVYAQHSLSEAQRRVYDSHTTPVWAVKTNVLYDATSTISLGSEFRLSNRLSLDMEVGWNPWTYSSNRKLKHISIVPELRYWLYEPFNGHFWGAHLLYSNFNVGKLHLPFDIFSSLETNRYRGNGYGIGFSYGYQWLLSPRWGLEGSFGFGYLYADYAVYQCHTCGQHTGNSHKHYFGPTKVSLSVIYFLK